MICIFFFFNDPATTEIYTLSLHDALPISTARASIVFCPEVNPAQTEVARWRATETSKATAYTPICMIWLKASTALLRTADRKSTRLNSSHSQISYAVFCLKKKRMTNYHYN